MTSTEQSTDPREARAISRRRVAMGQRLPLDERLDALNMVAWAAALIGDLDDVARASEEAMALVQPGQNPGFALGCASWRGYAAALTGDWDRLATSVDALHRLWLDAERPAASYCLQGLLSGVDWARGRGDEELLDRWREVATEIVDRFDPGHPVAALASVIRLDPEGLADIVVHPDRYPDRQHYVEHAAALCADRILPAPIPAIDSLISRAERSGMGLLEAQARRLRGLLDDRPDDLARSLELFEAVGAGRYAARLRIELGRARDDVPMLDRGVGELAAMGESGSLRRGAPRAG